MINDAQDGSTPALHSYRVAQYRWRAYGPKGRYRVDSALRRAASSSSRRPCMMS
jgi:hypothetical protein